MSGRSTACGPGGKAFLEPAVPAGASGRGSVGRAVAPRRFEDEIMGTTDVAPWNWHGRLESGLFLSLRVRWHIVVDRLAVVRV